MDIEIKATAKRIKELRDSLKLNQFEFGNTIGGSLEEIEAAEHGVNISLELIYNIAFVHKVNAYYLLTGKDTPEYTQNIDERIEVLSEKIDLLSLKLKSPDTAFIAHIRGLLKDRSREELKLVIDIVWQIENSPSTYIKRQLKNDLTES